MSVNKEWVDLMGKDIQVRKIKEGEGEVAQMGMIVQCNLVGRIILPSPDAADAQGASAYSLPAIRDPARGDELSEPFESLEDQFFKIGESDCVPGLELCLRHSRVGQIFEVRFATKYGFGPSGRPEIKAKKDKNSKSTSDAIPAIPANAHLHYSVEVTGHLLSAPAVRREVEKEAEKEAEKEGEAWFVLAEAALRKESGNRWYSYGDLSKAARAYAKGVDLCEGFLAREKEKEREKEREAEREGERAVERCLVSLLSNAAASMLGAGDFKSAREACVRCLALDRAHLKALLRGARAAMGLRAPDSEREAAACVAEVLRLTEGEKEGENGEKEGENGEREGEREERAAARREALRLAEKLRERGERDARAEKRADKRMTQAFRSSSEKNNKQTEKKEEKKEKKEEKEEIAENKIEEKSGSKESVNGKEESSDASSSSNSSSVASERGLPFYFMLAVSVFVVMISIFFTIILKQE